MNLRALSLTLLALWLAGAAMSDLRSRRIANRWLLAGTGVALALHLLAMAGNARPLAGHGWSAPLVGAALGLLLLLPLYLLGAMGAADIKLMTMVGAFVGPLGVATAVLYSLLAGGLLSLLYLNTAGVLPRLLANLRTLHRAGPDGATPLSRSASRLPYAVAIALGSAAALLWPLGR
ncbi:prepilin peptidase [Roseateles sp.]|uniref:prepilin peptidase n=1 Tax=Roseateles sp. TaxID=1971397 RepID=UPI0025FEA7E8|nr:prepilin peptidase [Roseateles sp.]MBV8036199.1 prepilin peptidase [Roseateles sp.]